MTRPSIRSNERTMTNDIEPSTRISQFVVYGDIVYIARQAGEGNSIKEQVRSVIGKIQSLLAISNCDK